MRNSINNIILKTAKAIYDNEKFPTAVLAVRANKIAEQHPYDQTAIAMSNFLSRKEASSAFISRRELKDTYNKLYTSNNKFAEYFIQELGNVAEPNVKYAHHSELEGKDITKEAFDKLADPVLSNALAAVFDKNAEFKPYSAKVGELAARTCLQELNRFVQPKKIDVVAGQKDLIICQATYDTPKGQTSVLVPVEIKENRALLPTVFLGRAGFEDISKKALSEHLVSTAGKLFKVNAWDVLDAVSRVKNGEQNKPSELDLIVAKAKLSQGNKELSQNPILLQEVDPEKFEVEVPVHEDAGKFASKLSSASGSAEFVFGKDTVEKSRGMIELAMRNFGYKNSKVSLANYDDSNLYFTVSIDSQYAFNVPVKIASKTPQQPAFVISAGSMFEFSKHGLSALMAENVVDAKLLAKASPVYGLKPSELVETVNNAMASGNFAEAEDALTVLGQCGDEPSYKLALSIYRDGLNGKLIKSASETCKCSMQRIASNSKYVICGHTNLPIHRVYQDEHGNCHPLYRKYIAEPEGASFLHTKVYFG